MRQGSLFIAFAACIGAAVPLSASATDWLQFGYDTAHSSFNRSETGYPTAGGNVVSYHYALPAGTERIDGAPVYLGNVATNTGTKTTVSQQALERYDTTLCGPISNLILRNRGAGPFGLLNILDERCGGTFDDIDDVIPPAERAAFMSDYKAAAGFAMESLNRATPIIEPGAQAPVQAALRAAV